MENGGGGEVGTLGVIVQRDVKCKMVGWELGWSLFVREMGRVRRLVEVR